MPQAPHTILARGKNAEVLAWEEGRVLKLFRPGYAHGAVTAEFRQAALAHRLGIPTPRPEAIVRFQGRIGIALERVEGPTLFHLVATRARPAAELARLFFDLQSAIQRAEGAGFAAIEARLASKIAKARGIPEAARRKALEALHRLPGGASLCHGDFHPVNVIVTDRGARVVDWLDAAHGPAAADAARTLLLLELGRGAQVDAATRAAFVDAYRERLAAAGLLASLQGWQLPVAAARLAEPVEAAERDALLARIESLLG